MIYPTRGLFICRIDVGIFYSATAKLIVNLDIISSTTHSYLGSRISQVRSVDVRLISCCNWIAIVLNWLCKNTRHFYVNSIQNCSVSTTINTFIFQTSTVVSFQVPSLSTSLTLSCWSIHLAIVYESNSIL